MNIERDLTMTCSQEEISQFEIPEHWEAKRQQWLTRRLTVELMKAPEFGCEGCKQNDTCEIKKAACMAMGENYPIFPADWLVLQYDYDGPEAYPYDREDECMWIGHPADWIMCKARIPKSPDLAIDAAALAKNRRDKR